MCPTVLTSAAVMRRLISGPLYSRASRYSRDKLLLQMNLTEVKKWTKMSIPEPTAETFDALILGSGEAGKYLSWSLGTQGKKGGTDRAPVHRWLLPKYRLLAEQEYSAFGQGRLVCAKA